MQLLEAALAILLDQVLRELELDAQRHQALLRSIVEVALDPAPLAIATGLDACPRLAYLSQRGLHLGGEPPVLQCDERIRGHRLHEVDLVVKRVVVDETGHTPPAFTDLGEAAPRLGAGGLHGTTAGVDPVLPGSAHPVHDLECRVTNDLGHGRSKLLLTELSAHSSAQPLEGISGKEPALEQPHQERKRQSGAGESDGPNHGVQGGRRRIHAPHCHTDRDEEHPHAGDHDHRGQHQAQSGAWRSAAFPKAGCDRQEEHDYQPFP